MNKLHYSFLMLFLLIATQLQAAESFNINAIKQAAAQGNVLAQSKLASAYYLGQGILADRQQAAFFYNEAAEQGDLDSMVMLAAMSDGGLGVSQNSFKGATWYKKAANLGHEPAKGVLEYYSDQERPLRAMQIAAQYAKKILKKQ